MSEPVQLIRAADLTAADPTPGMVRSLAFETATLWAGQVETAPGAVSGWHHHDLNETSLYVVSGVLRLEFEGYDGHLDAGPGDFVHVPGLHRAPREQPDRAAVPGGHRTLGRRHPNRERRPTRA
jgi:uncharacterized RmlC-like cupin family protein